MWTTLFGVTNLIALSGWIALIAGYRNVRVQSGVLNAAIGLLCLIYLALFASLFGGLVDPARVAGSPEPDLGDYSIRGLQALFQSDGAIVLGWTHYLAFDLLAGLWIVRDAAGRVGRATLAPFLFATFMAGPIGVFGWLLLRRRLR